MGSTALDIGRKSFRPRNGEGRLVYRPVRATLALGLLLILCLWGVSPVVAQTAGQFDLNTPIPVPPPTTGIPVQQIPPSNATQLPLPQSNDPQPLPMAPQPGMLPPNRMPQLPLPQLPSPRELAGPDTQPACPPGGPVTIDPALVKKYRQYIQKVVDPEMPLDLVVGQTRLMVFKTTPTRIQIANDNLAGYTILEPNQLSLLGKQTGTTVMTLWFPKADDPKKQEVLTYQVRIYPDPDAKARMQRVYDALADEINCLFKDCNVCLKMVGDKLVVTGNAHDVDQAYKILQIVRANAPDPRKTDTKSSDIPVDRMNSGPIEGKAPADGVRPVNNGIRQSQFLLNQPNDRIDELLNIGATQYKSEGASFVINMLRVSGEQQVMLRVTIAEVNRAAARSIGMNFSLLNNNGIAYAANSTGSITSGGVTPSFRNGFGSALQLFNFASTTYGIPPIAGIPAGSGGFNNLPAALDNGQIRLAISALRNMSYAKSLAEPTLTAMNGETARFSAGGEFPVPVVTGFTAAGLQGVNFVPYGVQLSFTPYITDRDRVRLVIAAEVSTRDLQAGVTNIGGAGVPSLSSRNFQTTVELREGQTLAVAGLIQNNSGADASRVPFLGDIPILNNLTGFSRITSGEQELVMLITPELVHPMEPKEVPPLPGSDLFEPNDLEFYLLGRIESHFPVDYRSPIRTDWQRMRQYREMENLYLPVSHGFAPID